MSEICLSNVDLCGLIALYLNPFDLLILEAVSKIWNLPVSRAYKYLRTSLSYEFMTYKHRNDYFTDKRMICAVARNRKHGSELLVLGGSFGSLHSCAVILQEGDILNGRVDEEISFSIGSSSGSINVNGEIMVIGGWDELNEVALDSVIAYNIKEGDVGKVATLKRPNCFSAAATTIQGDIIVMGGGDSPYRLANVFSECFISRANDLGVQEWGGLALPSLNYKRCGHAAVTLLDDSILVLGGYGGGTSYLNTVEMLTASLDRWIPLPSMSISRSGMAAVLGPGGAVYVTGGSADGTSSHKLCERYDPREGKKFYPVGEMNRHRGYTAGCIGSRENFYVSGGCHELRFQLGVEYFDFRMNKWTLVDGEGYDDEDPEKIFIQEYLQRACHQMYYIL